MTVFFEHRAVGGEKLNRKTLNGFCKTSYLVPGTFKVRVVVLSLGVALDIAVPSLTTLYLHVSLGRWRNADSYSSLYFSGSVS